MRSRVLVLFTFLREKNKRKKNLQESVPASFLKFIYGELYPQKCLSGASSGFGFFSKTMYDN